MLNQAFKKYVDKLLKYIKVNFIINQIFKKKKIKFEPSEQDILIFYLLMFLTILIYFVFN